LPGRVIGEYVRAVQSSGRNARLYLYGLFLCGLGQSIFSLLFNLYLRELGVSDAGIGQILSKISLGAAVAALPVAFLFRRVSSRAILVTAGALTAFTYLLLGSLVAPELLLLAAFVSGMVVTTFRLSIAPVVMREVPPPLRPYLFSAAFTVLFLAAIAGSALGGAMPHLFSAIRETRGSRFAGRSGRPARSPCSPRFLSIAWAGGPRQRRRSGRLPCGSKSEN